nr:hypothetical protein 1634Bnrm2_p037 [Cryptomonas sp.]
MIIKIYLQAPSLILFTIMDHLLLKLNLISFSHFFLIKNIIINYKKINLNRKCFKIKKITKENIKNGNYSIFRMNKIICGSTPLIPFEKIRKSISQKTCIFLEPIFHVAVVFSKHLIPGQISVEFSRRIGTMLTNIKSGKFKPNVISFIGGRRYKNLISDALLGYIYFRNLSLKTKTDLRGFEFLIEEFSSNVHENFLNFLTNIRKKYGEGIKQKYHFTLISSDYHLVRILEIYKLSGKCSILTPLYKTRYTWGCLLAAYPFCVSPRPILSFLGRVRYLVNNLVMIVLNMKSLDENNDLITKKKPNMFFQMNKKLESIMKIIFVSTRFVDYLDRTMDMIVNKYNISKFYSCPIYKVQNVLTSLTSKKNSSKGELLVQIINLFIMIIKNIKNTI